jgi:hypothetical protein
MRLELEMKHHLDALLLLAEENAIIFQVEKCGIPGSKRSLARSR